ncbi:MAG: Hsp20/alpha crystallin family protein [Bacteroidota bacterium]
MGLIKFNDRSAFPAFSTMLDDFFDHSFSGFGTATTSSKVPAVNVKESEKEFGLEVALPGVAKDQVNLELDHNVLTISSESKTEKEEAKEGYTRREFGYNSFRRSFTLPEIADQEHIDAKFEDGVLKVSIPKLDQKALKNTRAIQVN